MVLLLLSGNGIYISDPCGLDLLRLDPKNNRDPLLTETNHPMKFEDSGSNGSPVIEQKRYIDISDSCDLDLKRLDPKNNRYPPLTETNHPMKFEDFFTVIERK